MTPDTGCLATKVYAHWRYVSQAPMMEAHTPAEQSMTWARLKLTASLK